MVDTANLPGVSIVSDEVRHKGYGLSEARATGVTFDPITLTIIGDAQGKVLGFFQKWTSLVFNFNGEKGMSSYGNDSELLNYPQDYWGTLDIYLYDVAAKQYQNYKMHRAYPTSFGSVQLGWEQTDSLMRIPVTFSYRSFSSDVTDQLSTQASSINSISDSKARNIEQLEKILLTPNLPQYAQRLQTI